MQITGRREGSEQLFKIDVLRGRGDESLPQSHTCMFVIHLPEYSSEEVCMYVCMYDTCIYKVLLSEYSNEEVR